jgi:hypothetical protein
MLRSRGGRPSLIGTAARTAVITKTATSVAGSSAAKQQARAHEAELAHAQRMAAVGAAPAPAAPAPAAGGLEQLQKLVGLHESGILSDAEFIEKVKMLG